MSKAGKQLIESAQQALDFARGTADPESYRVCVPQEIDFESESKLPKIATRESKRKPDTGTK